VQRYLDLSNQSNCAKRAISTSRVYDNYSAIGYLPQRRIKGYTIAIWKNNDRKNRYTSYKTIAFMEIRDDYISV
jgi:hypothetical protein